MNNYSDVTSQDRNKEESKIDVKAIYNKIVSNWLWILGSVITCLIIAFSYAYFTSPTYLVKAKVLISDSGKNGGLPKEASALMDLGGIVGSNSSVDNEVEVLRTRFLLQKVVENLNLNVVYNRKVNMVVREIYDAPFVIKFIKSVDTIATTQLSVKILEAGKIKVSSENFSQELSWDNVFNVPGVGRLQLIRKTTSDFSGDEFLVDISSVDRRVTTLLNQLDVRLTNKQVSVIDLSLYYPLPKKGEDILNTLIRTYTEENLRDKNTIADSTHKFITERLNAIASELGDVEDKVEGFKRKNTLADMSEQGKLLVQNTGDYAAELAKVETQVTVLDELERYLKDEKKNKRVFPSSLLSQDLVFSGLMTQYNTLLVERDKQMLSVTEDNPFIENIDNQIAGLRNGILSNIQNTKKGFVATRDKLRSQLSVAENRIEGVPEIEKNYLKLARNQQIKQELYIFLMQKAEETTIRKTSNISIAKTIDPPKSEPSPVRPKKAIAYVIALFIGLIVPVVTLAGAALFSNTVTTKEDVLNATSVPVIGEISHNAENDNLIVANQGRSAISEQFRALRTNLSFYLNNEDEKVILITSSMSGEGKSFTAINLANVLSISGKRVILMEMDLRKPGISSKLNVTSSIGFSNYILRKDVQLSDLIKSTTINPNLFLITSGPLPPNPAELILHKNTENLLQELRTQFDYIIIDAPPVGIITDAQLLAKYADASIYVVRQNKTKKDQLRIAQDLFVNKRMKNLGIVVNDITSKHYGYGYGYGNYGESQ